MHTTVLSRGTEDAADTDLSVGWADWTDSDSRAFAHEINTPTALDAAPGWRWLANRRVRRAGLAVLLLEVGLLIGFVAVYRPFDLTIYLWGGRAVTHGLHLYTVQADANWFTYPPFAATVFTPLAGMPGLLARFGWELASVAALTFACVVTVRLAGYRPTRLVIATMVAAALLLEPMYHTLYLGQVNLILMALVLADVWRVSRGRPAGIGIGIAAAIKLVPGIFIVLLLVTRRTKDAAIAAGTFVGCGLIGYVVDPAASRLYWTRLFYDSKRVSAGYISNQSLYAAAMRILGGPSHVGAWFLLVAAFLGVVGLWVAAILARRGDWLGAAAVTGTTGLLVSPISWTHHWVWILPALVVLMRGGVRTRIAAAGAYLLFVLAPMWWTPHPARPGMAEVGFHGLTTLVANCFLIAGLAFLAYMTVMVCRAGALRQPRLKRAVAQAADYDRLLEPIPSPS
jgi:Glycosyltransferase family 87